MNWHEFDTSSALERNVLERALPLVATESTGAWRATINLTGGAPQTFAQVGVADTFGVTPERCIDLLQIRPPAVRHSVEGAGHARRGRLRGREEIV